VIATMMIVVALLLAIAEAVGKKQRRMPGPGIKGDALARRLCPMPGLIPGSSVRVRRLWPACWLARRARPRPLFHSCCRLPAIAASGLLELKEALHRLPKVVLRLWPSYHCFGSGRVCVDLVLAAFPAPPNTTGVSSAIV